MTRLIGLAGVLMKERVLPLQREVEKGKNRERTSKGSSEKTELHNKELECHMSFVLRVLKMLFSLSAAFQGAIPVTQKQ